MAKLKMQDFLLFATQQTVKKTDIKHMRRIFHRMQGADGARSGVYLRVHEHRSDGEQHSRR